MGQLRSSVDLLKTGVRDWLAKVKARSLADIYQPLVRPQSSAEEFTAYELHADYQERIHELNQLIGWLEQAVAVVQKSLGAVAVQRGGAGSGRSTRLIPVRPDDTAGPFGTPDAPLEVRSQMHDTRSGASGRVRVVVPRSLTAAASPEYRTLMTDLERRAVQAVSEARQTAAPPVRRPVYTAGPAVTLD